MWLLETSCARLKYFPDPESVPDGYAILSHVWDKEEQTFQETQDLAARCAKTSQNPRDLSREKIKNFCLIAEKHGHSWGWADSSCIDKSSSAELSEAINSMYRYYGQARVCYAYLRDVSRKNARDEFKSSAWHRRGWTLQELLAPKFLIFLTQDWHIYSTKFDLARELQRITGISVEVLTSAEEIDEMSVAQRMSWAAERKTTRLEDEAYCLMGIFGIHMPTLYGEGRRAFRRLQEEIMKRSVDTSLFAWSGSNDEEDSRSSQLQDCLYHSDPLADSPLRFRHCQDVLYRGKIQPLMNSDVSDPKMSLGAFPVVFHLLRGLFLNCQERASSRVPSFTSTSLGFLARIPTLRIDAPNQADPKTVNTVLFNCRRPSGRPFQDDILHLQFRQCIHTTHLAQPLYHIASAFFKEPDHQWRQSGREPILQSESERTSITIVWTEIYLMDSVLRPRPSPTSQQFHSINASLHSPFHIDTLFLLAIKKHSTTIERRSPSVSWDGSPPLIIPFEYDIYLLLGRCTAAGGRDGPLWASISFQPRDSRQRPLQTQHNTDPTHDCSVDHIEDWQRRRKTVIMPNKPDEQHGNRNVVLWFTPSPYGDRGLIPHVRFGWNQIRTVG